LNEKIALSGILTCCLNMYLQCEQLLCYILTQQKYSSSCGWVHGIKIGICSLRIECQLNNLYCLIWLFFMISIYCFYIFDFYITSSNTYHVDYLISVSNHILSILCAKTCILHLKRNINILLTDDNSFFYVHNNLHSPKCLLCNATSCWREWCKIGLHQLCSKIFLLCFQEIFPIMPKYQPIMLKIMLAYFTYCIIYHKITR